MSAQKTCVICGVEFSACSNFQKRCTACRHVVCQQCGKSFIPAFSNYAKVYCGRECKDVAEYAERVARINAHRGVKPRTYHLRHRDKHGSAADVEWRKAVFARDNYTCRECGVRGDRIQAHHIKAYKSHPELRHDLDNGLTLCIPCHKKTDTFGWQAYHKAMIAARQTQLALDRCDQEIAAIDARPDLETSPAYLSTMGRNDWEHEKALIQRTA